MRFRANVKRAFIDRKGVVSLVSKRRRAAMARVGGLIRTISRRSLRVRKGISAAGSPPHSHTRILRDGIYFTYDKSADTVVIGPVPAPSRGYDVPATLEAGGRVTQEMVRMSWDETGQFSPAVWFPDSPNIVERRRITYVIRARPYMLPAKEQAFAILPSQLINLI